MVQAHLVKSTSVPKPANQSAEEWAGRDVHTDHEVAIKLEHHDIVPSVLRQEVNICVSLRGHPGVPQVFWHGRHGDFEVMVFELLGPNLEDLFRYCEKRFSLKMVSMLMDELLRRLERLYSNGYVHRDIKPEDFLLGTGKQGNTVFVTDLGLAGERPAWSDHAQRHDNPPRSSLIGTCRYASINAHQGLGKKHGPVVSIGG